MDNNPTYRRVPKIFTLTLTSFSFLFLFLFLWISLFLKKLHAAARDGKLSSASEACEVRIVQFQAHGAANLNTRYDPS
jgi:hypothetical protein